MDESLIEIDDNGLSFIETSAFDSSNVETAFQKILTGNSRVWLTIEIYKIVSNKALEVENSQRSGPGRSEAITVAPTTDVKKVIHIKIYRKGWKIWMLLIKHPWNPNLIPCLSMDYFFGSAAPEPRNLRCRIGPTHNVLCVADINDEASPTFVDSSVFCGNILLRIKNYKKPTEEAPSNIEYFDGKRRLFSLQISGRFKKVRLVSYWLE